MAKELHCVEGIKQTGMFTIGGHEDVFGSLILNRRDSVLELRHAEFFHTYTTDGYTHLHGTMHDLTKISLLKCVPLESLGQTTRGGQSYNHAKFAPSFALFGDDHVAHDEKKIAEISFFVDDANALYYDFGAFGRVIHPKDYIDVIAAANTTKYPNVSPHATGPHPEIFYFTGQKEICTTDSVLGNITATHNLRGFLPTISGIKVENAVCVTIAFPEPVTFDESIGSLMSLLRFLELCIGRPQTVERLYVFLPDKSGTPNPLEVYWSFRPLRETNEIEPRAGELLLDPIRRADEYATVLANWLKRDDEWQDARFRFSTAFEGQRTYTIDRLIGAANMFDILPASAVPKEVRLPKELSDAREAALEGFRKLPISFYRDRAINDLGRLVKPVLKHKISHRAQMLLDRLDEGHIPGLIKVTDIAVDCRNHYVHGTEGKIDYNNNLGLMAFLTGALEFVFGASDLLEAGWDFKHWYDNARGMSHPFSEFLHSYPRGLQELSDLLKWERPHG